jgi:acetyltransferase-like isoleucine patch superfamily enzyme
VFLLNMAKKWLRRWRMRRIIRAGLQVGRRVHIGGWPVWGSEPFLISIADDVIISDGVVFLTHDGGSAVFVRDSGFEHVIKYGRITLHQGCFIGYRAILMPGVEIGARSVVAAGAVVTRSIPPDTLAVGVPARPVMSREEYARQALAATPDYDPKRYAEDKQAELLRLFPRPW